MPEITRRDFTAPVQLLANDARQLRCKSRLEIVPGATHLFEEPGSLERVVELARAWFVDHLPREGESHVVR